MRTMTAVMLSHPMPLLSRGLAARQASSSSVAISVSASLRRQHKSMGLSLSGQTSSAAVASPVRASVCCACDAFQSVLHVGDRSGEGGSSRARDRMPCAGVHEVLHGTCSALCTLIDMVWLHSCCCGCRGAAYFDRRVLTKVTTSWLVITSQTPSQANTTNLSSSVSVTCSSRHR